MAIKHKIKIKEVIKEDEYKCGGAYRALLNLFAKHKKKKNKQNDNDTRSNNKDQNDSKENIRCALLMD